MNKICENEMAKVHGGGWGLAVGIIAAVTFIIGIIDGYTNPVKCNN